MVPRNCYRAFLYPLPGNQTGSSFTKSPSWYTTTPPRMTVAGKTAICPSNGVQPHLLCSISGVTGQGIFGYRAKSARSPGRKPAGGSPRIAAGRVGGLFDHRLQGDLPVDDPRQEERYHRLDTADAGRGRGKFLCLLLPGMGCVIGGDHIDRFPPALQSPFRSFSVRRGGFTFPEGSCGVEVFQGQEQVMGGYLDRALRGLDRSPGAEMTEVETAPVRIQPARPLLPPAVRRLVSGSCHGKPGLVSSPAPTVSAWMVARAPSA